MTLTNDPIVIDGELLPAQKHRAKHKATFVFEMRQAAANFVASTKTVGSWMSKLYPAFTDWLERMMVLPAPTATPENYRIMSAAARERHDAYCSLWGQPIAG
jgi:hypothetical protein